MRRLHRPKVALPTLTSGAGARKAARHLDARAADPAADLDFPASWNEPDVRGALYTMHGRVCAFCLSELTRSDRGDVEHFRPKSLYFWLAYAFTNYVLSCAKCNRIFKHEHFPLVSGTVRITYEQRAGLAEEARLFLDPVDDPVETWLEVEAGDLLFRWRPARSLTTGSLEHARVTETTTWFHWNDDPDLVKARTDAIDEALFALENGDVAEARRRASRFLPHGGAVRSLFRSLGWNDLPTVDEEMSWLLEDLWQEWQWARRIGGELCEKKLEELTWAFAVLWKAPPLGVRMDLGAWLADAGIKAEVEAKYRQI
ncbi:MAG: hypothetical protein QM820_39145 [Minicystis sp.]